MFYVWSFFPEYNRYYKNLVPHSTLKDARIARTEIVKLYHLNSIILNY